MKIGALVVAIALFAIGFLPLFGGPGYEQAIATGLVVPVTAAIVSALQRRPTPLASVGRGALLGLVYAGIALVTALIHGARVGICEWWGALFYFALTAGLGSVLGGVWGAVSAEVVQRIGPRRPRLASVVLAALGPVGCVVVSLYRFWSSPMVFAFDPFVGYFSGTLYDTVIDAGSTLLTYRLGTVSTLAAVALGASILERPGERELKLDLRPPSARTRAALALVLGLASAGSLVFGSSLGYFSTTQSIATDLGAEKHGARCDVVYPSTTREQEALLLVKDCDEDVAQVERSLGAKGPARIRAFFFRDENDKKRLMGAAHTYIAKPWREEVYLQLAAYPHPVLAHEIAHVVAGTFGRGAFKVAGSAGGYLPNPGLIEGTAVAASPENEDLTDAQWARAMLDIGILPPMQRVFSLSFFGDASSKSYMLAGAFITWVSGKWGMESVRTWYGGGDIVAITGQSWPDLDRTFRDYLHTIELPAEAASFARARFARPSIFGRKCPHVVDALRHEADTCRDTQRWDEAIALYRKTLAKDPQDFPSLNSKAVLERRHGDRDHGRAALEGLVKDDNVPRTWRDRAEEALADADFVENESGPALESARARYEKLATRSLDEDAARTLEVKKLGTEDPDARAAVAGLLTGDEKHGPDVFTAGVALGQWKRPSPLASYLVGRNLIQRGFYESGAASLEEALRGPLPTVRIARETIRQRAIAACALGDRNALERLKTFAEAPESPFGGAAGAASGGRRDSTMRLIDRCLH